MQHKVAAAEGIRGIACFMVVFSHLSLSFFPYLHSFDQYHLTAYPLELAIHHSPFAFFYSGTAAVYIFFVLSGYVLSYAIMNSRNPLQKILSMTIKRFPRLMLPALGSCLLLWLAFHYLQPSGQYVSEWIDVLGEENPGPLSNAFFDGVVRTFWYGWSQYNWVLWTMKFELVGSLLVFALLYAHCKKITWSIMLPLVLVASYLLLRMMPFHMANLLQASWLDIVENNLEMLCFLLGMLCFFRFRRLGNLTAFSLLALGLYCAGVHDNSPSYAWLNPWLDHRTYNLLNFMAGPLVVAAILMNEKLASLFSKRIPVYLGKISFAAYLNHLLLIYVLGLPLFNYLHHASHLSYAANALLTCAVVIAATIIFSELYYRLVDQNAMRFSAWLANICFKLPGLVNRLYAVSGKKPGSLS